MDLILLLLNHMRHERTPSRTFTFTFSFYSDLVKMIAHSSELVYNCHGPLWIILHENRFRVRMFEIYGQQREKNRKEKDFLSISNKGGQGKYIFLLLRFSFLMFLTHKQDNLARQETIIHDNKKNGSVFYMEFENPGVQPALQGLPATGQVGYVAIREQLNKCNNFKFHKSYA